MLKAAHVRMARAGLGWSLQVFSDRAGVNPNTISRFESGKDILLGKLRRLEEVLIQAGVQFIDEGDIIGVRVLRQAKPEAQELKKKLRPRSPKKPV